MAKLSETAVKAIKWDGKDRTIGDGNGLYLFVRPSSKTWIIRQRKGKKNTITTLDTWPTMSVREARAKAAVMALRSAPTQATVSSLVEKYLAEIVDRTHKRPELARGYMDRAILPELGRMKVRDVTRGRLVQLIQSYTKRGARTADQLRSNLKALFAYALELGYVDDNPMLGVTRRVAGYLPVPRDRVLTDDEIRLLWAEASPNARLLRFLLLTGLRISEARKGIAEGNRWLVDANLSKNAKPHWVHLTPTAKAELPFPKTTATNVQAWLRRWCDRHNIEPRFTPHDLRRSAATRLNDNGVEPFIVERMLNHKLEGVMAVYNRAEYEKERIQAAETLEAHLLEVVSGGGR